MKNFYGYLLAGIISLALFSCKKELGALPKNAKIDANSVLDEGTAQIVLNGVYFNFANATIAKTGWQQHQVAPGRLTGFLTGGAGLGAEDENRNAGLSYYWLECYRTVNAANALITGVNALPENKINATRKRELLAEAKFLRAYSNFKLLIYYAEWFKLDSPLGILIRDEISTVSNLDKSRSSVSASYDFIISDLDEAISNAASVRPNHYVTNWAAMALKMRVLLCRGRSDDYLNAIILADNILKGSPYVLESNVENIFHSKGLSSTEVILGVKPQSNQERDFYAKSKYWFRGVGTYYVATVNLKKLYDNDPRQQWILGSANLSTSSPNTVYFTKYLQEGKTPTGISESDYVIRLTEVYLLKAEAIIRSGGSLQDAKSLIHTVQSKAGITPTSNSIPYLEVENAGTPDALLVSLFRETAKSLVGEDGMEWMALLRLPFATVQQFKPTITNQAQYILPVPRNEFQYNPSFGDQNPGYSKN